VALIQFHHQFKDHTEMVSQREVANQKDLHAFFNEILISHPLPEGARWLAVPEGSRHFVMMALKPEGESNENECG
jgi:hypothetical protein